MADQNIEIKLTDAEAAIIQEKANSIEDALIDLQSHKYTTKYLEQDRQKYLGELLKAHGITEDCRIEAYLEEKKLAGSTH
jgi:hypothetical protein